MLLKYAANSITAKAHALYGKRLTAADYNELLSCRSVSDAAAFLKGRTVYAEALESISPATVHRNQLENMLKMRLFDEFISLCRYEMSIERDFYKYFIMQGDKEQIITCLRLLSTEKADDYLVRLPDFFNQRTDIDLYMLARARNMDDVLTAIEDTPYKKILEPFYEKDVNKIRITDIETEFEQYIRKKLIGILSKLLGKKDLREIENLLKMQADLNFIARVYRIKRFTGRNLTSVADKIDMSFSLMKKSQIIEILNAQDEAEVLGILRGTVYGKDFETLKFGYIEDAVNRIKYKRMLHGFRYSSNAYGVLLCYGYLAENEINNIVHIIEGIRYELPRDEIQSLLIGTD